MPAIATTELFPSAAFISTDAKGDLQEVVGVDEAKAKIVHDGVTIESITAGAAGNSKKVEILEDAGASVVNASYDSGTSKLTFKLPASAAATASLTFQGLTFTAAAPGAAGNAIKVRFRISQTTSGGVEVSESGSEITIDHDDVANSTTQGAIKTAFDAAGISQATLSVASSSTAMTAAVSSFASFTNGADAIDATSYTQQNLVDAAQAAGTSVTDLFSVSAASGGTKLLSPLSEANLAGGVDEVPNELDTNAKYLLIKESDLYDLGDGEQNDGRKVLWGIVHNASELWAGKPAQPNSLTIARSAISSSDGGTALKQTYTITAKYAIAGLDLKAES